MPRLPGRDPAWAIRYKRWKKFSVARKADNYPMMLTELKYIVAVARERHFGRGAEVCHVSQPTLSGAIKKLEEELQVKLFERNANEITVTPLNAALSLRT